MENELKKRGRKAGGTNSVQKPPGKQTSVWLSAECLARLERLVGSGKHGKSQSKVICEGLKALEQSEAA